MSLKGTVEVSPTETVGRMGGEDGDGESDGTWLGDVVRNAVSRAMDESDGSDMQRF